MENGSPEGLVIDNQKDGLFRVNRRAFTDPHVLALVCNALLALDPKGREAGDYLDRLEKLKKTDGGKHSYWEQPAGQRTALLAGQSRAHRGRGRGDRLRLRHDQRSCRHSSGYRGQVSL